MKHAFEIWAYDIKTGVTGWLGGQPFKASTGATVEGGLNQVLTKCDVIFVCLPTPMEEGGQCSTYLVESTIAKMNDLAGKKGKVIVIKSTVPPGTTERINSWATKFHVCFNPEFLTERNSVEDFKNQDRIIVGGPREGTNILKAMYEQAYPDVPVTKTSATIAEMVKYTTNIFLAAKVSVANEIAQVCEALGEDYDKVVEYATKDKRLGTSHWSVPGPDGKKGFGGSCFPKDLNAFIQVAEGLDVNCNTLRGAWETNLKVRPEKDWEQLKGRAVIDSPSVS
jgi:UDPglucose 6-dehydrogenase